MSAIATGIESRLARTVRLTQTLRDRTARLGLVGRLGQAVDFLARGVFHVVRNRQYLTAAKLANMALVNVQFALKTERVIGRPYRMKIESTNICNTQCQLCPTGLGLKGRAKGKMSLEDFKRLVDQHRRHLYTLDLSMWGDPLIVPEIYEMIRHAHERGVWTYLSSNLHAFKPEKGQAEALVRSGLDMLTCSLHGASQATYELYQPGKQLGPAIEKIKALVEARKRLRSATPVIQLNFVVTRHNEHEMAAFTELAESLGCKAVFSQPSMNSRFLGQDKNLVSLGLSPELLRRKTVEHLEAWLPRNQQYVIEPYRRMLRGGGEFDAEKWNGKKLFNCSWPWQATVINWDGTVSLCCGSYETAEDMGDALRQPFEKIWNGPKYRMARRSFRKKVGEQDAQGVGCVGCPGFMV
ncbi:MAG: SPASM domain-containing protein [Phycisphaeraceae bacterium]|nr:SPASM domain-containing protein [Phycisphaeraceae bacterium]